MFCISNRASVRITDLEELLPLMQKNIQANQDMMKGKIAAESLKWYVYNCFDNCKSESIGLAYM